jgi:hypothetical protein
VTVFLNGATVMACAVAVLFFVRFHGRTRDALFARFAIAFALLGAHWTALALTAPSYEFRPLLYLIRLGPMAFDDEGSRFVVLVRAFR